MAQWANLVQSWPGELGLLVVDQAGISRVEWHSTALFPAASVIKVPLAWQWLELAQSDVSYTLQPADLIDSDGRFAAWVGQTVSRMELAREMIVTSENNATNIVLDWVGGFAAANHWLNAHACHQTRWQRRMCDWAARAAGQENQTSAFDMAWLLQRLKQAVDQRSLPAATTVYAWMLDCVSEGKLDLGLPAGATLAHKTGSLPDGVEHDVGIVTLPDDRWYAVAILSRSPEPETVHRARIAQLSHAVIETLNSAPRHHP